MSQPRMLMCAPAYYGIDYEINPWMNRFRPADRLRAERQWRDLVAILQDCGAQVEQLRPVPGLPDLVFTANAALICGQKGVMSNFRFRERQREVAHTVEWFAESGFDIELLPADLTFEGAGDALFCGDTLFAGYQIRSHAAGHQWIGDILGCRVIPVTLIDENYYHLDTCFCPLAPGIAVWYPDAFDEYGQAVLTEHINELIAVDATEARRFACNAVVIGSNVVTNSGCPNLQDRLRAHGFCHIETPLDEFMKSGGSAKCLTLRLDGEEAAVWPEAANGLAKQSSVEFEPQ